ncbi:MAG: hypothetical protein IKA61_06780 [Clostridia bacterium]|nr:hypothetical protein [Clostridia bacterium]
MKLFKKLFTAVISLILMLSLSASCFGVIFVPVVAPTEGLPGYTLTQDYVNKTNAYLETAKNYTIEGKSNVDVNTAWNNYVYAYYEVASQANVAFVLYASDASSKAYKDNYLFASEAYNGVYANYMKALQEIHAHEKSSGISSDQSFFKGWDERDLNRILKYTDKVASLENEISELQVEYASISEEEFTEKSVVIYKQIVDKNKQIATEYGFSTYYEYASDYEYGRDYTNGQLTAFRANVAATLPALIVRLKSDLETAKSNLTQKERETLNALTSDSYDSTAVNYWDKYVASYEGLNVKNDFMHAFDNKNVMFADGANSRQMAFNAYMPAYSKSYCYFGPGYQDVFTVSHEIGHYYAGLHIDHGVTSMDLNETHSQGNEMLLLEYLSSELSANAFKALELSKTASILSTVVISTIVDDFEYFVYTNDVSNFTAQDFDSKMNEICQKYGGREFVDTIVTDINRYWRLIVAEQPLYYISYATSGIASINLYMVADESRSEARQIYTKLIEQAQPELGFAGSLTSAGLVSPFEKSSFDSISAYVSGNTPVQPEEEESESVEEDVLEEDSESVEEESQESQMAA